MKFCPCCKEERPRELYYKSSKSKDGLQGYCKFCVSDLSKQRVQYRKEYRLKNKERDQVYRKNYKEINREKILISGKLYREIYKDRVKLSQERYKEQNPEKVLESSRKYRRNNKPKYAMYRSLRRASELLAQPTWLSEEDKRQLEAFWEISELKSSTTGDLYEVDHIVPLKGKTVCGLHVPWNLCVITRTENRKKQARHWPDMWEV